ncbi:hypothetical protein JCM10213_001291 [Rhodosporidiobolus nylandii]
MPDLGSSTPSAQLASGASAAARPTCDDNPADETSPAATTLDFEAPDDGKEAAKQSSELSGEEAEERIEVRRRWTIFEPFNFKPPPPPPKTMDEAKEVGLASASWLSQTTFSWIQPLLVLGYKRELSATDLPRMDPSRESGRLADEFERHFERRRRDVEEWNATLEKGEYVPSAWEKAKWKVWARLGWGSEDGRRTVGMALALSDTFFWDFWGAGIYKVVGDLAQTTSPLVTRQIIKFVQQAYTAHRAGEPVPPIGRGVGMAIGLFLMQLFYSVAQNNTFSRSGQVGILARAALIAAAYRKALKLSGKARVEVTNPQLMSLISTSISRIDFAATFFHFSWTCIIQLIEVIVILLCTIGVTSLAGVAIVLLSLPVQTYAMRTLYRGRQAVQKHTDERIRTISELISGIRIVKLFAWERPILAKATASRRKELAGLRILLAIRAAVRAMAMSIPVLASIIVFAVYSVTGHSQDPAEIWTSLSLLNLLRQPLMLLPNALSTSADAWSAMNQLLPVFLADELPEERFVVDKDAEVAIKVDQASFEWESSAPPAGGTGPGKKGKKEKKPKAKKDDGSESEKPAVKERPSELLDIDFEVKRGELCCVVGSVGSGKSSLLQGLIGEMRRTSGSVTFSSRSIAYCAQSAWISNSTVRENILFGQPMEHERYQQCIDAACLRADLEQLPSGDMTEIGERGIALSGGQRQRVAIARTLYFDADVLLLDDPLSAVDAHVSASIFRDAIRGMLRDKTVILVTHALQYIPQADSVIVLENGKIAEQGSYTSLMAADAAFSRFAREYGVASAAEAKKEVKGAETVQPEKAKEGGTAAKPLMQKEERNIGSIGLKTWGAFSRAAGWYTVPVVISGLVLTSGAQVMSNLALTWWQRETYGLSEGGYIGLYAGLGIAVALFTFFSGVGCVWFGTAAARSLHNGALEQVLRAPMSWFDTTPIGRVMNRFAGDVNNMDNRLQDALQMTILTVGQLSAAIILLAIVYQWFLIPVAVVLVLYWFMSSFYRASARTIKRHDNVLRSALFAWFSESLTGLSTIRAFGEQERFRRENEKAIDLENRAYILTVINQRWLAIRLDALGALLTFIVAIVAVAERTNIPSSKIGLVLSVVLSMQQGVTLLVRQSAELENNMSSSERLIHYAQNLEQEAPFVVPATALSPAWPQGGAISIRNATLRYRPELPPVLHDLSLEIRPSEHVGVIGRTGAGKSTLTQALFRIIELSEGKIEIDGVDIRSLGLTHLRERLALIPQEPLLFKGTIRSNLDPFGVFDDVRLNDALRRSWLIGSAEGSSSTRFNLETPIDDEGANLSLGERSLVSLARALVRDTRIVLLDECTASVDLETDGKIQSTIATEFRDKTLLTIAHRLQTVLTYDRILVLEKGRVDAFAPPLELFDQGGLFRSLCEQSGISRDEVAKAQEKH